MCAEAVARKSSCGKTQSLCCHTYNVMAFSASLSHYPNTSKLIAYLHDIGKSSTAFQKYINDGGERGSIVHAWQGSFLANELITDSGQTALLLKEIIGFCITAHHNHLDDGVAPDGTLVFFDKLSKSSDCKYFYDEIKSKITDTQKDKLQNLFESAKPEISALLAKIKSVYKDGCSANFALGLFVKYLYSVLVDADRLDAYLFDVNEEFSFAKPDWDKLIKTFEENIAQFPGGSEIAKIRKSVSDKCKNAFTTLDEETGIIILSKNYYSSDTGVVLESISEDLID